MVPRRISRALRAAAALLAGAPRLRLPATLLSAALLPAALLLVTATPPVAAQDLQRTPHGDWIVTCNERTHCFAGHQAGWFRVLVGRNVESGELRATMFLEKDTTRGAPVTLLLDTGMTIELLVTACHQNNCEAAVDPEKTRLVTEAFKKAGSGVAAYQAGTRIRLVRFSLKGSTAAIQAVGG